jgi:fatty-acyl-CoA synthase
MAVVGLSLRYRDTALPNLLADSEAKAVFTLSSHEDFDFMAMFGRLGPQLPGLRHIAAIDGQGLNSLGALAATPGAAGRLSAVKRRVVRGDVAMVISTSGTTGRPKGAGLTHRSLLADAAGQAARTRVTGADLIHLGSPLRLSPRAWPHLHAAGRLAKDWPRLARTGRARAPGPTCVGPCG